LGILTNDCYYVNKIIEGKYFFEKTLTSSKLSKYVWIIMGNNWQLRSENHMKIDISYPASEILHKYFYFVVRPDSSIKYRGIDISVSLRVLIGISLRGNVNH